MHAITFRLAENEYRELIDMVTTCGAKSISDFSRAAVLNKMAAEQVSTFFEEEMSTLAVRLEAFDTKLREARRHIRQLANRTGSRSV